MWLRRCVPNKYLLKKQSEIGSNQQRNSKGRVSRKKSTLSNNAEVDAEWDLRKGLWIFGFCHLCETVRAETENKDKEKLWSDTVNVAKEQTGKEVGGETACLQVKSQEQVETKAWNERYKRVMVIKKKGEEVRGTHRMVNSLSKQTGQFWYFSSCKKYS